MVQLSLLASVLGGIAAAAAILMWPATGLVALLVGGLLVPGTVPTGTGTGLTFPSLLVPCLLVLWLCRLPWQRSPGRFLSAPFPALAGFMAIAVLSGLLASDPRWRFAFAVAPQDWFALAHPAPLAAQVGQLGIFALSVGTFVLVADQVPSLRWLQVLTWTFLVIGAACVSGWVVPELRGTTRGLLPAGVVDGSLFWTWLVALAFTQAAFNGSLPPGVRLALAALVSAALYVTTGENREWVSGWIPALVTVFVGSWLGAPRLAVVATLAGAVALVANGERLVSSVMTPENQYSLMTRLEAWRILGNVVLANPVLGLGPANYYHHTAHFPILGWNVRFSSHNNYLDVVAQTGFAGLACLGWFAWRIGRLGWTLRADAPVGFGRAYVLGALAGLAGTIAAGMLGDWFLPFVYNTGLPGFRASMLGWFFLGGLAAVERASRQPPSDATRPPPPHDAPPPPTSRPAHDVA